MKRFLLYLTAITLAAAPAAATQWQSATTLQGPLRTARAAAAAQRMYAPASRSEASQSMEVGYCGEPRSSLAAGAGARLGGAIWFNSSLVQKFAGNRITAVMVANGSTADPSVKSAPLEVFVSTALTADPIATASGEMDFTHPYEYQTYTLPEPIEITTDTPLYVGFAVTQTSDKVYPLVVDYLAHDIINEPGGFIGVGSATTAMQWDTSTAQSYGYPCLKAVVEGDNLPVDMASMAWVDLPYSVQPGVPFEFTAAVTNMGSNPLDHVTLDYTVAGGEKQSITATLDTPIYYGQTATATSTAVCAVEGNNLTFEATVTTVNDKPNLNNTALTAEAPFLSISAEHSYPRTLVVEEGTGTWCGWCPRGIVAMEKMRSEHPDGSFIGIAVHASASMTQRDPMACSSYSSLVNKLPSFPSALVNRNVDYYGAVDPAYEVLSQIYDHVRAMPAMASVTIDTVCTGLKNDTITASVTFGLDVDSKIYRLAYVVMEDGVGPYDQTNYFSATEPLEGWDRKGSKVSTVYNDVARAINSYNGVLNSLPATIAAGETVSYTGKVSVSTLSNHKHARYAALLINTKSSCIENAALYTRADYEDNTAITEVETESSQLPVSYFNLQGRQVTAPHAGQLLIRRQGRTATKIIY